MRFCRMALVSTIAGAFLAAPGGADCVFVNTGTSPNAVQSLGVSSAGALTAAAGPPFPTNGGDQGQGLTIVGNHLYAVNTFPPGGGFPGKALAAPRARRDLHPAPATRIDGIRNKGGGGAPCSFREDLPVLREDRLVLRGDRPVLREDCLVLREDCPVLREDCPVLRGDRLVLREDCPVLLGDCLVLRGGCSGLRGGFYGLRGMRRSPSDVRHAGSVPLHDLFYDCLDKSRGFLSVLILDEQPLGNKGGVRDDDEIMNTVIPWNDLNGGNQLRARSGRAEEEVTRLYLVEP